MSAARKLHPQEPRGIAVLMVLPLSSEPATDEEIAIFEAMEADIRAGIPCHSTEEMLERIEDMQRDDAE